MQQVFSIPKTMKKDYKEILECFTYYSWEKPNLKAIKPEGIPEYT